MDVLAGDNAVVVSADTKHDLAADNADVLASDNADVLDADNASVVVADNADVLAADNKFGRRAAWACHFYRCFCFRKKWCLPRESPDVALYFSNVYSF